MKIKNFSKSKRALALLLALIMVVGGLAVFANVLTQNPMGQPTILTSPSPGTTEVPVGNTVSTWRASVNDIRSSNTDVATVAFGVPLEIRLTGVAPGPVTQVTGSSTGALTTDYFFVVQNANIAQYTLPVNAVLPSITPGQGTNVNNHITALNRTGGDARNTITWVFSMNSEVAAITPTGVITTPATRNVNGRDVVNNATTFVLGTFVDVWGVNHTIALQVVVGTGGGIPVYRDEAINDGDGGYLVSVDRDNNVYIETDRDGRPIMPPVYWDRNDPNNPIQVWPNPDYPEDSDRPWVTTPPGRSPDFTVGVEVEDDEVTITVSPDNGNNTIVVDEDNNQIIVTIPDAEFGDDKIGTDLPPGWGYEVIPGPGGNGVIVIITPPDDGTTITQPGGPGTPIIVIPGGGDDNDDGDVPPFNNDPTTRPPEFEVNGVYWIILQDNRHPVGVSHLNWAGQSMVSTGDDSVLIMTRDVHGVGQPFNVGGTWARLNQTTMRTNLNTWWTDHITGTILAERARFADGVISDVRNTVGGTNWQSENEIAGRVIPGWISPNAAAQTLFILSISEANHYFGHAGVGAIFNAERVAHEVGVTPAGFTTARAWFLRSPASDNNTPVACVNSSGSVDQVSMTLVNSGNAAIGFRPAMWINAGLPLLYLSESELYFSALEGGTDMIVGSETSWTAVSDSPSWLTVDPASGPAMQGVMNTSIVITPNTTGVVRTGTVTFTNDHPNGGRTRVVTVTQAGE